MKLANQHNDDPFAVTPENTAAIVFGVQRSGSSYVWQLACDVFQAGVVKTHYYLPASKLVPTFCVYRDFRDAVVSGWRHQNPARSIMTGDEIRALVSSKLLTVGYLDQYAEYVPHSRLLRYESFIADPNVILRAICEVREVDATTWQTSLAEHSLERNRQLSENGPVPSLLLVHRHVQCGEVGTWRRYVDDSGAELLTSLLRPVLTKWGYAA